MLYEADYQRLPVTGRQVLDFAVNPQPSYLKLLRPLMGTDKVYEDTQAADSLKVYRPAF